MHFETKRTAVHCWGAELLDSCHTKGFLSREGCQAAGAGIMTFPTVNAHHCACIPPLTWTPRPPALILLYCEMLLHCEMNQMVCNCVHVKPAWLIYHCFQLVAVCRCLLGISCQHTQHPFPMHSHVQCRQPSKLSTAPMCSEANLMILSLTACEQGSRSCHISIPSIVQTPQPCIVCILSAPKNSFLMILQAASIHDHMCSAGLRRALLLCCSQSLYVN